jgi:hypothetical protein
MGWTVLYIAFGIVALWLLGEVLLQYKARLRWRLLAFAGFVGVVLGVLIPSVIVIGIGAAAFAVGQTYVTLSFRRGFVAGWAVKRPEGDEPGGDEPGGDGDGPVAGRGGGSKRRRGRRDRQEPVLEVSELEPEESGYAEEAAAHRRDALSYGPDDDRDDVFAPGRPDEPAAAATADVYEPQPVPDDTGNYGVYGGTGHPGTDQSQQQSFSPSQDQDYAAAAQDTGQNYGYDYSGYGQQQYGYDADGQQQYAGYSDPYGTGGQAYGTDGASYDAYGQQQYGQQGQQEQQGQQQGYGQDQYGTGGYAETPAGGVWVPQQRNDETYGGALPPEQPYPYQQAGDGQQQTGGYDDQQYRF